MQMRQASYVYTAEGKCWVRPSHQAVRVAAVLCSEDLSSAVTKDGLTLRRATLLGPEVVPGAPQPKGAAEL